MTPTPPPARRTSGLLGFVALAALLAPTAVVAQSTPDDDGMRLGVSFGGVSTFGVVVELFDGNNSIELTAGTWSFRDLSLSLVGKRYFLDEDVKPFVGAGLWWVLAKPPDERTGMALVLRVPIGVDASPLNEHHFETTLNLNRALLVRRTDPEDDIPLNKRLVPLPQVGYRFEMR